METIVLKFGGTSVGTLERIAAVAKIIKEAKKEAFPIVVVSAMSGETDRLINLANSVHENPPKREYDALISTGEKVSAALVAMSLDKVGVASKSYSAAQISMKTTAQFSKAKIINIDFTKIEEAINNDFVPVITGFQGITDQGDITTLGRGGSDTTAVAIAAAMKSVRCDIYTDVDGVYTTDPNVVPEAKKLDQITMEEMLELSGQGAKVMQVRAVEFASKYKVPVRVLSSFKSGAGTLISLEEPNMETMEKAVLSGIAFQKDQSKFTFQGVKDSPGIAYSILSPIAAEGIEVDVIIQNISNEGKTDFTFTTSSVDRKAVENIFAQKLQDLDYDNLVIDDNVGKVSIVGVGMRTHAGIASRAFEALARESINISMISTSEIKITLVINVDDVNKAVQILHSAFELEK
ncbi:MAG: aspartate kinase [Gammaproteobacteria bacterium]